MARSARSLGWRAGSAIPGGGFREIAYACNGGRLMLSGTRRPYCFWSGVSRHDGM
jgi:hypothetical protein